MRGEKKHHKGGVRTAHGKMNVHGGALCFMDKRWARHKTTETVVNNG